MKKIVALVSVILYTTAPFAQGKAMLTKDETINYINRTLQKAKGYKCLHVGCLKNEGSILDVSFITFGDDKVKYQYTQDEAKRPCYCCWDSYTTSYTFSPTHIATIELDAKYNDPPIYYCNIKFIRKGLVQTAWKDYKSTSDELKIYFLMAENGDFTKLKKAFEHLRDLCKAEDDPFGQ
jgi:hypothetical protein